jgi:hypothetical protein
MATDTALHPRPQAPRRLQRPRRSPSRGGAPSPRGRASPNPGHCPRNHRDFLRGITRRFTRRTPSCLAQPSVPISAGAHCSAARARGCSARRSARICLAFAGERRSLCRSGFSVRRGSACRASRAPTTVEADGLSRVRQRRSDPNRLAVWSHDDCKRKRRCVGFGSATLRGRSVKCPARRTRAT